MTFTPLPFGHMGVEWARKRFCVNKSLRVRSLDENFVICVARDNIQETSVTRKGGFSNYLYGKI